jgi:Na+-driven multidrug efflux pump
MKMGRWWLAFHTWLHTLGVFPSVVFSQAAIAAASMLIFQKRKWKEQKARAVNQT